MTVAAQRIQCASCGAGIDVPPDLDRLSCAHCGTPLAIVRGEGYVAAKLAARVAATIEASGQATIAELRRTQRLQELAALRDRIARVESEDRTLSVVGRNKVAGRQRAVLLATWNGLVGQVLAIEEELGLPPSYTKKEPPPKSWWWW